MISSELIEWVVGNRRYSSFNDPLCISDSTRLKRIVIGDECFGKVRLFELDGLSELESIEIGKKSFGISTVDKRNDSSYRIVNCPKLQSIAIGDWSFCDYHSFELTGLPSLHSIDIGGWCFRSTQSFRLTGLLDRLE